jgi:hypothetical protein
MISDLFELRQVLLRLVKDRSTRDSTSHHGYTLELGTWVQLDVCTTWISIVTADNGDTTSTLHNNVACIALLFLSFLIWHKDGWQLGLYETRQDMKFSKLTRFVPVNP